MKKLFVLVAATLAVCGLCVAPIFAIGNEAPKAELPIVGAPASVEE